MANRVFDASFKDEEWTKNLGKLSGPLKESLARRMLVSGGTVLRDEAKERAPLGIGEASPSRPFGGSKNPGLLKSAIYLAYATNASTTTFFTYRVSWNHKLAPHGHLVEFGHWQPFKVIYNAKLGKWQTINPEKKKGQKNQGKFVEGKAFLGPTYDARIMDARAAMIERGRVELPILLRET